MIRTLGFILLIKVYSSFGFDVRIAGFGNRPHHGRVEIFYSGEWGTVCDDGWDMADAHVVCRELGFPGAVRALITGEVAAGTGKIWLDSVRCNGTERRLSDCLRGSGDSRYCYHSEDAGVICHKGVRVQGLKPYEGKFAAYLRESWYSVCRDSFDIETASVACRELGFMEVLAVISVFNKETSGKILSSISCDGTETRLIECKYKVSASESCPNNIYGGMICKEDSLMVRITGEVAGHGQVEIIQGINWLPVCADRNWNINNGEVVCRELGFPGLEQITTYIENQGVPKMNVWKYSIYCNGSEKSVFNCSSKDDLPFRCHKLAGIRCKSALRLVDMNSANVGRLEAFTDSTWGTVCRQGWSDRNGIVACRELGFPGFKYVLDRSAFVAAGKEKIAYNTLTCFGNEKQLSKCTHYFGNPCYHYQDIGLVCNKRVRIWGLNHSTEGRLEIFYNGKWGSVAMKAWTGNHTRVACKELGFPDGQSQLTRAMVPQGSEVIWTMDGPCTGEEMSLSDCVRVINVSRSHESAIGIKCEPVLQSVRLKGGTSRMGHLEIFHQGEWGMLCNKHKTWSDQDSSIACRELGFPGIERLRSGSMYKGIAWTGNSNCSGNEKSISECFNISGIAEHSCYRWYNVILECKTHTRLIKTASSMFDDAVQVYLNGNWGKICDDGSWSDLNSKVVCKSLGYNPEGAIYKSMKAENLTLITEKWFSNVRCDGHEDSLTNCLYFINNSCPNRKYVGIKCRASVRLSGNPTTPFFGKLEIHRENIWGSLCYASTVTTEWPFHTLEGEIACRELGFPGVISVPPMSQLSTGHVIDALNCLPDEKKLANCLPEKWQNKSCLNREVVGVLCKPDVRLQDGQAIYEGFLEIFWKDEWSRICSPDITMKEARVICLGLGYDKPLQIVYKTSNYTGKLWMNKVTCTGDENSLHMCNYETKKQQNCSHQRYPYINCGLKESRSTLRIVGTRTGEGRVEILHHGTWGNICDYGWDVREANVVCNALGFPGAFVALDGSRVTVSDKVTWVMNLQCKGNESSLHECGDVGYSELCYHTENAGVICNKGIRLRNKAQHKIGVNEDQVGVLEVYHEKSWGAVCSNNWTNMNAAKVACRQLGYPIVQRLSHVSATSNNRTKFWLTSISCNGSENTLLECKDAIWKMDPCMDGKEVKLHCSNGSNSAVRLVGGSSNKEGEIQMRSTFANDIWGALCYDENWNDEVANVICRQLGYTGVIRTGKVGKYLTIQATVNWKTKITCQGDEKKLSDCKFYDLSFTLERCEHASMKCQQDIRISGGANPSNGAVELYYKESWFPVCGDLWDMNDSSVACRHLGYPTALNVSRMGTSELLSRGDRWTTISCSGNEKSLNLCEKKVIPRSACDKVANVKCEPGIRLVGSSRTNEGRVEIFSRGSWGTICGDKFDMIDANVICKELGYVGASSKNVNVNKAADPSMKIHINELACDPGDYFWQCSHNIDRQICNHYEDIKVFCISVALGESTSSNEGRIEIYNGGVRSFAVSNSHNNEVADVACREMGFPGAWSHYVVPIESSQVSFLKNITCQGDERTISECRYMDIRNRSSNSLNILGVICESQIRLRGGYKESVGRVEVYFNEAWGSVCDDYWHKNKMNGKVACRQLGYPDISLIYNRYHGMSANIPHSLDDVNCIGNEKTLIECPHITGKDNNCYFNSRDVAIECKTEIPGRPVIVTTSNGTSLSFDILIKPPSGYHGHLKYINVYAKPVRNEKGELLLSRENKHIYFEHYRNLNVPVDGYYYLYNISISVENDVGEGHRTFVMLWSEEDVPGAPKILSLTHTNGDLATSVNVTWEKPENPNGIIIGYIVYWEKRDRKIVSGKVTLPDAEVNSYVISNLDPDSSYLVQVSAFTSKGEGKRFSFVIDKPSGLKQTQPTSKEPSQSNQQSLPTSTEPSRSNKQSRPTLTEPSQSNKQSIFTDNTSNKITLALAILFGIIILVLVVFFFIFTKTPLVQKCRAATQKKYDTIHIAEFENEVYGPTTT